MPSTYSDALRIELIGTGEQDGTWGTTTNTNLGTLIEDAIAGYVAVTHDDSANYTLTANNGAVDEARNMIVLVTGTITAARNIVCPSKNKLYVVKNSTTGGFAVTVKTSGGNGVSVPNGKVALVYCDGTNVLEAMNSIDGDLYLGGVSGGSGARRIKVSSDNDELVIHGGDTAATAAAIQLFSGGYTNFAGSIWLDAQAGSGGTADGTINIRRAGVTLGQFTSTGLNACAMGATTASTGRFTTLQATTSFNLAAGAVAGTGDIIIDCINSSTTATDRSLRVWHKATAGDNAFIEFLTEGGGTARGSIDFNRGGTATRYNTTSDARLKNNISDAIYDPAWLPAVKVREFDWRETGQHAVGFIAQELVDVEPDAVSVGDTGEEINKQWAVDPSKLIYRLVLEVQHLRAELEALKAEE